MMTKKQPVKEESSAQKTTAWQTLPGTKPDRNPRTRIVIKCDVGFGNQLYIRGHGAGLNWEKGTPLKNIKADEWIWESSLSFSDGEFKILLNDAQYESGENHRLVCGSSLELIPKF